MEISLQNLTEIKDGVSKKKVYRKSDQRLSKIIIDFSNDHKEFYNFIDVYDILKLIDITIPRLYEVHFNKKIIIMEDLGDKIFHNIFIYISIIYFIIIIINIHYYCYIT